MDDETMTPTEFLMTRMDDLEKHIDDRFNQFEQRFEENSSHYQQITSIKFIEHEKILNEHSGSIETLFKRVSKLSQDRYYVVGALAIITPIVIWLWGRIFP